ncbi:MAG: excinuclease ABC subunit UvrA [Tannerellaceae bacterium]|jgi:excinuclease ABC subunit A|nr:excinuclease ABC subunit UvrA [Tannerellaceae bacterium]
MDQQERIDVFGARVHNLKNIDVSIPRNQLTVITGMSGSGKSSLAFDTIFAEGKRRYIETFSSYARGFLGNMERPDVDKITGLSPVISIEQKTTNHNPRSTVGTITEIYDFLRLLYARVGEAYSHITGEKMVRYTEEQVLQLILQKYVGQKIYLLAPLVHSRKGHYKDLFEQIRKKGYLTVRVDGTLQEITYGMKLDRYKKHTIEVVIDKLRVTLDDVRRLTESLHIAMKQGDGLISVLQPEANHLRYYSRRLMDPVSGLAYDDPAPHTFSFNSPQGACPRCKGWGYVDIVDMDKLIPDRSRSIHGGAILALGKYDGSITFQIIESICEGHGVSLRTPFKDLPKEVVDNIINGIEYPVTVCNSATGARNLYGYQEGIAGYIRLIGGLEYFSFEVCEECKGARLNKEALHYRIGDYNIVQLTEMDIAQLFEHMQGIEPCFEERRQKIASPILKEIRSRLQFLLDVGLDYLSLNMSAGSLSGGESQRIRLATQVGSKLVNVLYILDEPSIGLHERDNIRLIHSLKQLRDQGNTVIVVEHDREMMLNADYIVDLGPCAGKTGGEVVFSGTPAQLVTATSLTADYLNGKRTIPTPAVRREGKEYLTLKGAKGNNLREVTASFPLGTLICVTGVSGSGKSTLINDTLYPALSKHLYRSSSTPMPFSSIEGLEYINKVIAVDQSPIGNTTRSSPATYTEVLTDIRNLFASLPDACIRGYKAGRFSFNVSGGRCETCKGHGYKVIEMNFLPDVFVACEDCGGRRYNRETLEIRFRGKSIADVLDMTVNQAVEFFAHQPKILSKIKTLQDVGLGYVKLGQPSPSLSGGESQRVKLGAELSRPATGRTVYLLDEPTTGLHFEDIRVLLDVLNRLVDRGNTVIIIEHNPDIIRCADYIIDMGPEGGRGGGQVLFYGTPEALATSSVGYTSAILRGLLTSDL